MQEAPPAKHSHSYHIYLMRVLVPPYTQKVTANVVLGCSWNVQDLHKCTRPHQEAHAVENPPKVGVARLLGLAKPNPKVAAQSEMDSSWAKRPCTKHIVDMCTHSHPNNKYNLKALGQNNAPK